MTQHDKQQSPDAELKPLLRVAAVILVIVGSLLSVYEFILACLGVFAFDIVETPLNSFLRKSVVVWYPLSCLAIFVIPAVILWQGVRTIKPTRQMVAFSLVFVVCLAINWQSLVSIVSSLLHGD